MIEAALFEASNRAIFISLELGKNKAIAVKIINNLVIDSMKILEVEL